MVIKMTAFDSVYFLDSESSLLWYSDAAESFQDASTGELLTHAALQ